MAKAPPTIAATSTLAMLHAADARGVESGDLLAELGLTRAQLEDPDARLPGGHAVRLWNALRERTGDPALQLEAPTCLPFGAYRTIDYIIASSATVGDGIRRFVRFFGLIADAVTLTVEESAGEHGLRLAMADGAAVPAVYVDYVFAALVRRIRMRIHPGLRVSRVMLRQPAPATASRYREVFDAPVAFGAGDDCLVFDDESWRSPFATGDEALAQLLEEHARILERQRPVAAGFRADVERQIIARPGDGGSATAIARALNVSVRTLQRKLVAEGTTFADVATSVRGRLAESYLADRAVSIAEVACLLGFSDESSFNRAFRRWAGEPPGRWRRRRAGPVPAAPVGAR
jgi:AraC-like DNA-binding protein